MTGFRQKFWKIAFESLRNKFHLEFFNGSHRVSSLIRQLDKINHRLRFYCTIDRSSPLNCTVFLYVWDIAATAESSSGRRFCALFEYVLHYPQGNEGMGDIRSSWVDVTTAAGPILLRLGRATKRRCSGAIFEISSGHRKSRIYPNQKIF